MPPCLALRGIFFNFCNVTAKDKDNPQATKKQLKNVDWEDQGLRIKNKTVHIFLMLT